MNLGQYNILTILRFTSVGAYLGDEEDNDVLLPNKYLTSDLEIGDQIPVFLYKDSEDRLVATTERPKIILNTFAYLKVKEVNTFGAFLDWGLEKDLLIPYREQHARLEEEKYYLVYLKLDEATNRLVATTKTKKYFNLDTSNLTVGQEVSFLIGERLDNGIRIIVEEQYQGIIFHNNINRSLKRGTYAKGFVYQIREDGKLDIRLEKDGYQKIEPLAEELKNILEKNNGILYLTDHSDPDEIREMVGMSKKAFKQAVGNLYKNRIITIANDHIQLNIKND